MKRKRVVDGVRVTEPAVEQVNFDLIPLDDIERVEVHSWALGALREEHARRRAEHHHAARSGAARIRAGARRRELRLPEIRLRLSGPAGPLDYYVSGSLLEEDALALRAGSRVSPPTYRHRAGR